jgi:seryl-tRNA synthetase
MLSLDFIRRNAELVRENLVKLNTDAPIDEILVLDERRRDAIQRVEALRARRNEVSKRIGATREKPPELIEEMRRVGDDIKALEADMRALDEQLDDLLLRVPNMPRPWVPVGKDDSENVVLKTCGEQRVFDFTPKPHWELGEQLGIIDFDRGVKISGSRFYVLKRDGARLQRALITYMLDLHVREHGYTEVYPPYIVKRECMVGTGNLPKFAENLYRDEEDDLWLIPTAEVPVTNLHREEIIEPGALPLYYCAYSACFRREKMSAGKDVRGLKRGHQFDKVELVKLVTPETSDEEHEKLTRDAEDVVERLGLSYRRVQMCTGDLSFVAANKFDIDVWAPGVAEWLEVSSCGNFTDFQARRANIRFRREAGARPEFVHTLNGSGVALPRLMIAVMESYQQADGSIRVPDALIPYMGGQQEIR